MRSARHAFVGVTAMAAVLSLCTATAHATTTAPIAQNQKGYVQLDGGKADWVSLEYIEKHPGVVPGISLKKRSSSDAGPYSTHKCDDVVCLDITGKKLHIDKWSTQAVGNVGCSQATFDFFKGGYADRNGRIICPDGSGPGVYFDNAGPTGWYRGGTEVCNYSQRMPGSPCAEIHD
ncbi:hypothetical protein [Wenjunlia tyrosinilytica]|nr:hypothetical protein [Wenjunlia tyrosinilytica]